MKNITFAGFDCKVKILYYSNQRPAIQLIGVADGMPVATGTINFPKVKMPDGYAAIKDYAENEGMAKALIDAGVIAPKAHSFLQAAEGVEIPIHEVYI